MFDLMQENAHFAISEALMAAVEHMKWNQVLRPVTKPLPQHLSIDDSDVESDEEIVKLKKKIQVGSTLCLHLLLIIYY